MAVKDNWIIRAKNAEKILSTARKSYEKKDITRDVFEGQVKFAMRKLEYLARDVNRGVCDIREEW